MLIVRRFVEKRKWFSRKEEKQQNFGRYRFPLPKTFQRICNKNRLRISKIVFYHFQRQQCETRMKTTKAFIESTFLSNFHNFAIIIIYIFATKILQFQNLSEFTVCWMKIYIHANITTLYIRTLTDQRFIIIYTENVC